MTASPPGYALVPRGGAKGQGPRKASGRDFDIEWVDDPVRTLLSGTTAADGTKAWAFADRGYDLSALGLTVRTATPGARARVVALSRTSCTVKVEADAAAVTVATIKVLSAASPQAVAGAGVTLELVAAP